MTKKAFLQKSIKLKDHQTDFSKKYNSQGGRQIAFHGLGSGKTITSINAVENSDTQKALILTPAALQKNYLDTVKSVVDPKSQSKYNVMSYEKFRRDPDKFIESIKPDTIVVDEFHRDKDPKGVSYKALQRARPYVKHFMGLTGTVTQNTPAEVFPLLNLVSGENHKIPTKKEFEHKYLKTEKVYPKGLSGVFARIRGSYGEKSVLKNKEDLQKRIGPFVHKNVPDEDFLKQFPKREEVNIEVPMTSEQSKRYDYFMNKDLGFVDRWRVKHDLPPQDKGSNNFFAKLMHAREVSNTPSVVSKDKIKDPIVSSGKLTAAWKNLNDHLAKNPQHKAVIYSNFTESGLKPFQDALTKNNVSFGVFTGKVKKKAKNQDVVDFNEGKKRVLLISPSGAEGLDLKGTTLLQNIDKSWNPSRNEQVIGRAIRFKSHAALPPEMQKVRVENYYSVKKPGLMQKLFNKKPAVTIDKYISNRADEKQDLNKQFQDLF